MKKALSLTALSAALLISFPAFAADAPDAGAKPAPAAAKPVKPPSEMFEALSALGNEIKDVFGASKGNPIPYLDKLAAHEYSADTRAKLAKVFGSTEPLTIKRATSDAGMLVYTIAAPAHSYTDAAAVTTKWSDMSMNLVLDKAGQNMTAKGAWPSFSISDKAMTMTASGMTMHSAQRRNAQDVWLGKVQMDIGSVAFAAPAGGGAVLEGISFSGAVSQRGKVADIAYAFGIDTVKVGAEKSDALRMALRLTNIDMKAIEAMNDGLVKVERSSGAALTPEQQLAKVMTLFKAMGKTAAARGSALEIDDLSVGFGGNRAVIKGKLSLAPASEADFASPDRLSKKVVARLNVRLPVVLVTDIAKAVMAHDAKTKGKQMSAEEVAQGAQTLTDVMVGKMLNGGFAKLDNGVLLSLIEFKAGKLTFNGKEVALPKRSAAPRKPAAAAGQ